MRVSIKKKRLPPEYRPPSFHATFERRSATLVSPSPLLFLPWKSTSSRESDPDVGRFQSRTGWRGSREWTGRGSSGTETFEIGRLFDGLFQPRSLICRVIKKKEERKERERRKGKKGERGGKEGEKKGEKNSRVIELRCLIGLMRRWTTRNDRFYPLFEPVRKIH